MTHRNPTTPTDATGEEPGIPNQYFTAAEMAQRLKVHKNTIRNMIAAGEIRVLRFRRRVRIPIAEVQRFEREAMQG